MQLVVLLILWVLMCGEPLLAYQEMHVHDGATIRGQIVFHGEVPQPQFLPVYKNKEVCGDRMPDESLQVGPHGEVRNVAVVLQGIIAGKPRQRPLAILDNVACAFVPRVQTLTVGQVLEMRNSDPVLHTVHARQPYRDTLFHVGLPTWRRVQHHFQAPGFIAIDCDVLHTWMRAYIIVSEHPYATVTDAEGRFLLDQVPPGQHTVRLWHERLGTLESPIQLQAEQQIFLTLAYGSNEKRTSPIRDQPPAPNP